MLSFRSKYIFWSLTVILIVGGIIGPMFMFWVFYGYPHYTGPWPISADQIGKLGPISDWISGLVVPCFTLASFILVFLAYKAQREELTLQSNSATDEKFQTTFFNLLSYLNQSAGSIRYKVATKSGEKIYQGHEYFHHMSFEISNEYVLRKESGRKNLTLMLCLSKEAHSFFEIIYCILNLIDKTELNNKDFYIEILQATISPEQKSVFRYYNSEQINNFEKRSLVDKYDLLGNKKLEEIAKKFEQQDSRSSDAREEV